MGLLLETIAGEKTKHTPVWFMRQAGRYMPEYRAVRSKYSFLQMCYTPEIACQITLQPIEAFDTDAAILFSDILPPLVPMGFELEFRENVGPLIHNPITCLKDVKKLSQFDCFSELSFVGQALKLVRQKLDSKKDLIGFSAAPFTLASYAIEGGSSKNFSKIKALMYKDPITYHTLLEKITQMTQQYLLMQLEAGADIVQIFDSWGGILSRYDYLNYAHKYSVQIINFLKSKTAKPIIHFVKGSAGYFEEIAQSKADVLGVDWTLDLDKANTLCRRKKALQGNLDPLVLLGSQKVIAQQIDIIKKQTYNIRHIFNLGHGIIPQTPVENVKFAIDYLKDKM